MKTLGVPFWVSLAHREKESGSLLMSKVVPISILSITNTKYLFFIYPNIVKF